MTDQLIRVDEEAKEFIRKRGGVALVGPPVKACLCCGRVSLAPDIKLAEPPGGQDYLLDEFEGIKVYRHRDVTLSPGLSIGLAGFWGFKHLVLNGWRII